jgi:hypothetical protein
VLLETKESMMEIIYAIYKENIIPSIGGVNPDGIEIGLAEYNGWKLCAMSETEFNKFSEFKLYPLPKTIAVGMALISKATYETIQEDLDEMPEDVVNEGERTEQEIKLAELASEYIDKLELKFITRAKVRQFKDFEDDLSDTKLMVEFLLGYIAEDFISKTEAEKSSFPMKELMEGFISSIENKNLRINNEKLLNKIPQIIKDETLISRIVKSNYIDKLKIKG